MIRFTAVVSFLVAATISKKNHAPDDEDIEQAYCPVPGANDPNRLACFPPTPPYE